MPTRDEDFKQRFDSILLDLRISGRTDGQTMWLVGSLAARLIDQGQQPTWSSFKHTLSQPTFRSLISSFQKQGNDLAKTGATQQVYAIQVVAVSLVAVTQTDDPEIVEDDKVLDQIIEDAISIYREAIASDPIIS